MEWSKRMAASEMKRRGETLMKDGAPRARWDYTSGLFAHALLELNDPDATAYATRMIDSFVMPGGSIATYKAEDFNIDMIAPGRVLLRLHDASPSDRYRKAIEHMRAQLRDQPRTSDGGFWHKQRYPYQMWLDGIYMGSPFLAGYAERFEEPAAFDEVAKQILLMDRHSYDEPSGLFHHAWDEKRQQTWADPKTGRSPCFWGRAIGWYAMALVDCMDHLPSDHRDADAVRDVLKRLAEGAVRYQDATSGVWWQVMDQPKREGNYQEASVSCMLLYSMAKAIRQGNLPRETYLPVVEKAYAGVIREFIRTDDAGEVSLTKICEVAGLGFTSSTGRARDGSFDYYISEPVIDNDLKGVGPFILAGIEMQLLLTHKNP